MSDHEGVGVDDWDEASLPEGPTSTYTAPEGLVDIIRHDRSIANVDRFGRPNNHNPRSPRLSVRGIPGISHRKGGVQNRTESQKSSYLPPIQNAAYGRHTRGDAADNFFQLSSTWLSLVARIPNVNGPPGKTARSRLNEICRNTDTYISTPDPDSTSISIWGEGPQIAEATGLLTKFELHIRNHGVRPSDKSWAKITAHDGRAQTRLENRTQLQDIDRATRFTGHDIISSFELYLLWPEEVDMAKFMLRYDTTILAGLRRQYFCHIDFRNEDLLYVKIGCEDESMLMAAHLRIQNLVAENMRTKQQAITLNLLHLPVAAAYQQRVRLNHDRQVPAYFPELSGGRLPDGEAEDWDRARNSVQRWNRKQIRRSINLCLASLQAAQMHITMKFSFGRLGFISCQLPREGEDGHTFDEFYEMMGNHMTQIKQDGLYSVHGDISNLPVRLNETGAFQDLTTLYTVQLDLRGQLGTERRLETVFKQGFDEDELDTVESRWLQLKDAGEALLLEINMLNLEHQSYQFRIEAADIFKPKSSDPATAFNQSNVGFTAPSNGLQAPPKRRANFPVGNPNLLRVTEIISKQYQFRNTEGILEIRREDIYDQTIKPPPTTPTKTLWTANYFYPEWENLLRDFGSLQPGQELRWARTLGTFFPSNKTPEQRGALPDGFRNFMSEMEEIQGLLTRAMKDL